MALVDVICLEIICIRSYSIRTLSMCTMPRNDANVPYTEFGETTNRSIRLLIERNRCVYNVRKFFDGKLNCSTSRILTLIVWFFHFNGHCSSQIESRFACNFGRLISCSMFVHRKFRKNKFSLSSDAFQIAFDADRSLRLIQPVVWIRNSICNE